MMVQECPYEPPHTHEFPADWEFGGATGTDPRADRRWTGTTYEYLDGSLRGLHVTQVPLCDDQAIDEFTKVAGFGPDYNPVYLQATRPDGSVDLLPWQYDAKTDTVSPVGGK